MPDSQQILRRILTKALNNREQQEKRISSLLHDDMGQILSAAGLQLDVLRMDIEKEAPDIARRISENQKLLEQAVESVRKLSQELNPAVVERAGLEVALERLVESADQARKLRLEGRIGNLVISSGIDPDDIAHVPHQALGHEASGGEELIVLGDVGRDWHRLALLPIA